MPDDLAELERRVREQPGDLARRLKAGFALLDSGRPGDALLVFQSAARAAVLDFPAQLGLAKAYRALGDLAAAIRHGRIAAGLAPGEMGVRLDLANDLLATRDPLAAEALFQAVVIAGAGRWRGAALLGLGRVAEARDDASGARDALVQALEVPSAALEAAEALARLGDVEAALRGLQAAEVDAGEAFRRQIMLGRLAQQAGRPEVAAAALTAAEQLDPYAPEVAVAVAEHLYGQGLVDAAAAKLHETLNHRPEAMEVLLQLSEFAWRAEDYEGCLELSLRAAAAHPLALQPVLQATRPLMELGRTDEALTLLSKAGAPAGWPISLLVRRAEILLAAGRWAEAREILTAPGTQGDFGMWLFRSRLHLALGEFAAVEALIAEAPATTASERGFLRLVEGQLKEAQWDFDGARQALEAAAQTGDIAAAAHAELARLHMLACDIEGAVRQGAASLALQAGVLKARRQLPSVASTHVGQVLDEFRFDPHLTERLRAVIETPPEAQIAPLLELVRAYPDQTPPAMFLMIALRRAGRLNPPAGRAGTPFAPRRLIQFWDDPTPPPEIERLTASWRTANGGFDHRLYSLAAAGEYIRARFPAEIVAGYIRAPQAAQKADVFRLAALAAEGGVWADADDLCLADISPLLAGDVDLVLWQEHFGTVGNNFIAARPGHPVLLQATQRAAAAMNRRDVDIPWLSTGPGLLTRVLAEHLAAAPDLDAALARCRILERFEVAPFALFHRFVPYKRTPKHWLRAASLGGRSGAEGSRAVGQGAGHGGGVTAADHGSPDPAVVESP